MSTAMDTVISLAGELHEALKNLEGPMLRDLEAHLDRFLASVGPDPTLRSTRLPPPVKKTATRQTW